MSDTCCYNSYSWWPAKTEKKCEGNLKENYLELLEYSKLLSYRVEQWNLQVVRPIGFEHLNEIMVQNSSPTCKHNLFALIQGKKMFFKCLGMWESSKRLRESELPCADLE